MMWAPVTTVLSVAPLFYNGIFNPPRNLPNCRAMPSDASWPDGTVWDSFNKSIDGRLIRTVPLGSVCHDPTYDAARCKHVQNNWHIPELHEESPSSIMDPIYLNKSCDPFTQENTPCLIGAYVQYAVNVSETQHVIKTVKFVKNHNIRFVVKNTGHDFLGRSTGTGALSVWMHNLREIDFVEEFKSSRYSGPAFKASAGVLGEEMTAAAGKKGLVVVSGECPTVGFAGGYIQGGGHSVLSSKYGLAADQTLSFEVITPNGDFVTASPTENMDLYWALSGGGGGTYGIVWSVTVKAHPDTIITVGLLQFGFQGISQEVFWDAISTYLVISPAFADANTFGYATYSAAGLFATSLSAINRTADDVSALLAPLIGTLERHSIQHTLSVNTFPTYTQAFASIPDFQDFSVGSFQIDNRLIPESLWKKNSTLSGLVDVLRGVANGGGTILDVTARPTLKIAEHPYNAVLPAWRDSLHLIFVTLPLDDRQSAESIIQDQHTVTRTLTDPLRKLTPGSGAYMNEASPTEPNFKTAFYGRNYRRLLSIKDKYDPDEIMYGSINVGGDRWKETEDGRLCRTRTGSSGE